MSVGTQQCQAGKPCDSDTSFDYPDWPMWLCLCERWIPWPTCFTARRHRRRHRQGPIPFQLSQAPIFLVSSPCLSCGMCSVLLPTWTLAEMQWRVKPFCAQFRHLCVCRLHFSCPCFGADVNPCAALSLCSSQVCKVKFLHI